MDAKLIEELRQKYSKISPEGMTSDLVKNMTTLTFWICTIFLPRMMTSMTMNLKKVFTLTSFNLSSVFDARFCAGSFLSRVRRMSNFPII